MNGRAKEWAEWANTQHGNMMADALESPQCDFCNQAAVVNAQMDPEKYEFVWACELHLDRATGKVNEKVLEWEAHDHREKARRREDLQRQLDQLGTP